MVIGVGIYVVRRSRGTQLASAHQEDQVHQEDEVEEDREAGELGNKNNNIYSDQESFSDENENNTSTDLLATPNNYGFALGYTVKLLKSWSILSSNSHKKYMASV